MKKSLSLLVAIAMVISMFASVASAATAAGTKLEGLGIIKGDQNGNLLEDSTWKRQDVAVLLSRLLGVEMEAQQTAKSHTYADVRGTYYDGFLSWAKEEGLMEGHSATRFGFDEALTYQQFAAVVLRALGVDTSDYAAVPELAVEAGLVAEGTDFAAPALRGATYEVIVTALDTVVEGTGQMLGTILGLPGYEVTVLAVTGVEQTDAGEITVTFNKAATEDEQDDLEFTVARGQIEYTIDVEFNEDGNEAVLSSAYLPAGDYTVTVGEADPIAVSIQDGRVTKIEIGASSLKQADGQSLNIKVFNQFGKEVENPTNLNVSLYNATKQAKVDAISGTNTVNAKFNLGNDTVAELDDNFIATVLHTSTGVSANKTFKIVAGSAATSIKLGTVEPLEDETRITAGDDGLVLPYELTDQYGEEILLAEGDYYPGTVGDAFIEVDGITFFFNTNEIVEAFHVDEDGVLTFDTVDQQSGTLFINAVNPTTGATGSTTVTISSSAIVDSLQLSAPAKLLAAGEEVVIPFAATDSFGAPIDGSDVVLGAGQGLVNITSNLTFAAGYPKINGKGQLLFKFADDQEGTAYIYAYVTTTSNGQKQVGSLQLSVNELAEAVKVNGTSVAKYFAQTAAVDFDGDDITYLDNYSRTQTVGSAAYTIVSDNPTVVNYVNGQLVAGNTTGKAEITISLDNVADSDYTFTVQVVKDSDIKSYEITDPGTIYGGTTGKVAGHTKTIKVSGKLSSGTTVALNQATAVTNITSSNTTVLAADVTAKTITGIDEGTSTVTAYQNGTKLASITVTVSEDVPVATTVAFDEDEYEVTVGDTFDFATEVTVKDQYGVAMANPAGFLTSSDTDVASVNGSVVTAGEAGQATVTFIASNDAQASVTLVVNN
ncbi:S-layer homology domain-containing protein [Paenibacillus sp. IB182496]|uniref:S-layer homology domain-containing protein n=1 Tax=Paenibacillus sabuli TaxID=2772509 RepID=A0A927GRT8_9BACL|nr:S-layer homology domain-containing protein [Paenibacillus sabuli]MBD2845853.1 S-layer homology domain-containing protein [Paenibacillus sabuli]